MAVIAHIICLLTNHVELSGHIVWFCSSCVCIDMCHPCIDSWLVCSPASMMVPYWSLYVQTCQVLSLE